MQGCTFSPWVRKIPWRRKWQPTAVFLPGKSHGQSGLADCNPWGYKIVKTQLSKWLNNNIALNSLPTLHEGVNCYFGFLYIYQISFPEPVLPERLRDAHLEHWTKVIQRLPLHPPPARGSCRFRGRDPRLQPRRGAISNWWKALLAVGLEVRSTFSSKMDMLLLGPCEESRRDLILKTECELGPKAAQEWGDRCWCKPGRLETSLPTDDEGRL